eukprot:758980-Hanusia_phi.AAC.1
MSSSRYKDIRTQQKGTSKDRKTKSKTRQYECKPTYSPNMPAVLACNLPGQLHAGQVAHLKKSKTLSSKRHDALLARSRFWREVQRARKLEQ